jgi:thymidylate synthase (FAD)
MFITPNAAQLIEAAGRTCYKSESKITDDSAERFVAMITKRGHYSVIEHAYAMFRVITDRGITHEIVRHRIASYSQESSRYCNYSKAKFGSELTLIPPSFKTDAGRIIWQMAAQQSEDNYNAMIAAGEPPEIARGVLLTNQKTEIVMTANFREWLHFLKLRTDMAAHPDMRIVACLIGDMLAMECPAVFEQPCAELFRSTVDCEE